MRLHLARRRDTAAAGEDLGREMERSQDHPVAEPRAEITRFGEGLVPGAFLEKLFVMAELFL